MNFEELIHDVYHNINNLEDPGKTATYIPELARVDPAKFGVHITTIKLLQCGAGDFLERFSIQSIAKVLSLSLAYQLVGDDLWRKVGVEPSGTPFNSLLQLEADKGIPRNPFLNAGALVISDILLSTLKNPKEDLLDFVRGITNNAEINYNPEIARSERVAGYRNIALCNFIKSFGTIDNDPDRVLEFYFNL